MELQEVTPDPDSESSKPLLEPGAKVLIKTLGSGSQSPEPLWEGPYQVILSSPTAVKVQELIHGYITLELRHGTLTRTKRCHFIFTFYALTLYFSDGPDNLCEPTSADSKNSESAI